MSRNYYSELHLHMVWHTKLSLPLRTPEVEGFVHRYLRGRLINTPGVFVHEVGGTENHVHVTVTVPPTVLVSELIGRLKGASSHEANHQPGQHRAAPVAGGLRRSQFRDERPGMGQGIRP